MPLLIPELSESLGTWLFQVAMGISISRLSGSSIYISRSYSSLRYTEPINYFETIFKYIPKYSSVFSVTGKILFYVVNEPEKLRINANATEYIDNAKQKNIRLHGWFFNWRYVPADIHRFLTLGDGYTRYPQVADSCCIHMNIYERENNPLYQIDLTKYYMRAIEYIQSRGIKNFIILTKNPNECLSFLNNVEHMFIDENEVTSLSIMVHAKACIMSNSPLSWWGSFLNRKRDICIPDKFFNDGEYEIGGMYFPGCIVIQT